MSKSTAILFSVFQKVTRLFWGTGVGKIPGAYTIHSWLFRSLRQHTDTIEVQGSKLYVNPKGLPQSYTKTFQSYVLDKGWEELTTQVFKDTVKDGDVVVDLGANIGYFTLLAARLVGKNGKVYAFEPESTNYGLLVKNIELNGYKNVIAVQKAVSNTLGKVRLFLNSKDTGAHTIYQSDTTRKFVEVESITLDEFFKDKKHHIDVIKMDIEGAEMAALSGMERVIKDNPHLKIFAEFYFEGIEQAGNTPREFARKLLEDHGFSIVAIGDYTKDKKSSKISSVDELMYLCRGNKTANLLLQKTIN